MADDPESGAITGGCNCGAIRYTLDAAPVTVAACHCTSCRRQSGAAYSVNLLVQATGMAVTGELARWTDHDTESGQPLFREFCGTCGSPIRSASSGMGTMLAVKAGTLDRPDAFAPALHIFTASKLAWVTLPEGMQQFAQGPRA